MANRFDQQPEEITTIKNYIQENLHETVAVGLHDSQIIISVRSSALAGTLRPHLYALKKLCNTEKKLVIRIG